MNVIEFTGRLQGPIDQFAYDLAPKQRNNPLTSWISHFTFHQIEASFFPIRLNMLHSNNSYK